MVKPAPREVTQLLLKWRQGDVAAFDQLMPIVYDELRRMARYYMRRERPNPTMLTSDLVHEAYLRLIDHTQIQWQDRAHFLAMAARAMRRILVDHARRRQYTKRGGDQWRVTLSKADDLIQEKASDLVALDDALTSLASLDPRKGQIVELRYFGGLSVEETAEVLGVAPITVMRDWRTAKAWLLREMQSREI
jgi:RNA polymerase sigma factor (TIGR02999 family)